MRFASPMEPPTYQDTTHSRANPAYSGISPRVKSSLHPPYTPQRAPSGPPSASSGNPWSFPAWVG
eukprot:1393638-Amorphochlora_amoeboformis.AAC.1